MHPSMGSTPQPHIGCRAQLDATRIFGGYQSARTIHFFAFVAVALFLLVHILMVLLTGVGRQLRGMTLGLKSPDIEHD